MSPAEKPSGSSRRSDESPKRISHQRRTPSWEEQVVVFIESNDDLFLTSKAKVQGASNRFPHIMYTAILTMSSSGLNHRAKLNLPWVRSEKQIFVPPSSSEGKEVGQHVATVKLSKVLKGHRLQRYFGRVRSLYVFECPLPAGLR
jgi:hypothetical protein